MQLGFILLLAAIAIAMAAALTEERHVALSWCLSVVCGLFVFAAAWDFGMHPQGLARAWNVGVANVIILFLWGSGIVIELGCLWWAIKGAWRRMRR